MRFLLPLFLCLFAISAQATIHTVSNDPNNPAEYDDLHDAQSAAAPGDTIYLTPSPNGYGQFAMNRRLVLIGHGYVPVVNGQFSYRTYISRIIMAPTSTSSLNGSKFIGLEFDDMVPPSSFGTTDVSGITIERCLGSVGNFSQNRGDLTNFNIKHSFIGIQMRGANNFIGTITNSFIFALDIRLSTGTIIKNCIIVAQQWLTIDNVTIDNSIILETNIYANRITNSTFTNNLFLSYGDPLPIGTSNNGGSGNIFDTNPQFEIYDFAVGTGGSTTGSHGDRYKFYDTEDYHLKATSPGKFYGTDGTDIGMYGGTDPFPSGPYTGAPPIPRVTLFNLLNGIVGPNGQLNYEVEATTQN